jgi:virulence-associated protein VapD
MGKATKGLTVIALTFGLAMSAHAAKYVPTDNSIETALCVKAATASTSQMDWQVRRLNPGSMSSTTTNGYKSIVNSVYCNGVDITEFAASSGNLEVAEKMEKFRTSDVHIRDIALAVATDIVHVTGSK